MDITTVLLDHRGEGIHGSIRATGDVGMDVKTNEYVPGIRGYNAWHLLVYVPHGH